MSSLTPVGTFSLLQAVSILIFQTSTGLSFALALKFKPTLFATTTVVQYYRRTRYLSFAWLTCALGWMIVAFSMGLRPANTSATNLLLGAFCIVLWLGVAVCQVIVFRAYSRNLPVAAARPASLDGSSEILKIAESGDFKPIIQELNEQEVSSSVRMALTSNGVLLLAALATFGVIASYPTMPELGPSWAGAIFILALYVSLVILTVDLSHDVWPGKASKSALQRVCGYYVYIFEQWVNWTIPACLMFVAAASIYHVAKGRVGAILLGFPLWFAACLLVATFWNQILHRVGWVRHRLPILLTRNRYSSEDPTWAYFFTFIHVVMLLWIFIDMVYLNVRVLEAQSR